jgi:hypothetical protein
MGSEDLVEDRTVFISSCSRRELARRRPTRAGFPTQWLLTLLMLALAAGAVLAARGGV